MHSGKHGFRVCCSRVEHPGAQSSCCVHICEAESEEEHAVSITNDPRLTCSSEYAGFTGAPCTPGRLQNVCVLRFGFGSESHCIAVAHSPVSR